MKGLLIVAGPKKYGPTISGMGKAPYDEENGPMPEDEDEDEEDGEDAEDFKAVFSSFCKNAGIKPENPEKAAKSFKTLMQMVCHKMM